MKTHPQLGLRGGSSAWMRETVFTRVMGCARKFEERVGWMLVCGLIMVVTPAFGGPITWTFTNAIMDEQRNVSGSFVYDADTTTVIFRRLVTYQRQVPSFDVRKVP